MSNNSQQLSASKEKQYDTLVKCYEEKEYKKGIKVADTILKEYPKNGKTLCMKALINYLLNKDKDAAEKEIKAALLLDAKNAMCWQTLGLFYRHCKDYAEARKAFSMSLMRNPSNLQVIIDLAALHMQNRDIAGYRKCYQKLIGQISGRGNFWIGMMVGYYLEGNYSKCLEAISVYRDTLDSKPSYERQELLLLEVRCYSGMKDLPKAISTLRDGMKDILNEDSAKEQLAVLYGKNGQLAESQAIWEELLKRNSENYRYYRGIECCLLHCFDEYEKMDKMELLSTTRVLSEEDSGILLSFYQSQMNQSHPSQAVRSVLLHLLKGEEFTSLYTSMCKNAVRKGVPSFFRSIRSVFRIQSEKFEIVKSITEGLFHSLQENHSLDTEEEEPFVFLWLVLLLAQIEDYANNTKKALEYTDLAYQHTPTCYDYYIIRSRILKHAGYLKESASVLAKGYELDQADRFTNTKLTKYYLKCGDIEAADRTVSYWTKKNISNRIDLNNLEGNWFEVLCGWSYLNKHDIVHANKLFNNVIDHFDTYVENQFDFHPYVLRKTTLSTYFRFLSYVDGIFDHKYYRTAGCGALECAVELAANPLKDPAGYLKKFGSIAQPNHGSKEDEDKDMDGVTLAQTANPLQRVETVAKRLLSFEKTTLPCMESVLNWGIASKRMDMIEQVIEKVKSLSLIGYLGMIKRVEKAGLANESMMKDLNENEIITSTDYSMLDSVRYLAELQGVDVAISKLSEVKRFSLDELKRCYTAFVQLEASNENLMALRSKAKEYYEGIDEYLQCFGY